MKLTIADPAWKTSLFAKTTALEDTLTNQKFAITADQLHRTRLEELLTALNTKVDTIFTPLNDTFEYQHIMQLFDDQCDTDKETALFNAKQRSDTVATQIKENKKLSSNSQEAFNMTLSAQIPHSQHNSLRQDDTL